MKRLILCLVTLSLFLIAPARSPKQDKAQQQPIPNFTLPDTDGKFVSLKDFKGKHVVVFFWASWCPYCIKAMPDVKAYSEKYKDKVVFIGINSSDTFSRMKKTIEKNQIGGLINLYDPQADVAKMYGIPGYPFEFILFPDGSYAQLRSISDLDEIIK